MPRPRRRPFEFGSDDARLAAAHVRAHGFGMLDDAISTELASELLVETMALAKADLLATDACGREGGCGSAWMNGPMNNLTFEGSPSHNVFRLWNILGRRPTFAQLVRNERVAQVVSGVIGEHVLAGCTAYVVFQLLLLLIIIIIIIIIM